MPVVCNNRCLWFRVQKTATVPQLQFSQYEAHRGVMPQIKEIVYMIQLARFGAAVAVPAAVDVPVIMQ